MSLPQWASKMILTPKQYDDQIAADQREITRLRRRVDELLDNCNRLEQQACDARAATRAAKMEANILRAANLRTR